MEDPQQQEQQESAVTEVPPPAVKFARLRAAWSRASTGSGRLARRAGLFLFMTVAPLLLVAYPAYRIVPSLLDYAAASPIEATLQGFDIRTVESGQDQASWFESRKHIDVVFYFKDAQGKEYGAVVERPWPAPGLKRKLGNEYAAGDAYTLLRLPDQSLVMDEQVAKDSFLRLTALMALVFVACMPFFLLWKRLAHRQPDSMPPFPVAGVKSLMVGQLVALVLAAMLAVIIAYSPTIIIPPAFYLAGYWGLTIFLGVALRLLVFEAPPPPAPPETEEDTGRRRR